jgi:hypothetical protein
MELRKNTPDPDDWVRQFVLSEEYLLRHHPQVAGSPGRRFDSPNVVDLVRVRRLRLRSTEFHLSEKS